MDLAKVSSLLDEAREELEGTHKRTRIVAVARAISKIDEAQRLLLGDEPTDPANN